jgi:hypothetical protein
VDRPICGHRSIANMNQVMIRVCCARMGVLIQEPLSADADSKKKAK